MFKTIIQYGFAMATKDIQLGEIHFNLMILVWMSVVGGIIGTLIRFEYHHSVFENYKQSKKDKPSKASTYKPTRSDNNDKWSRRV